MGRFLQDLAQQHGVPPSGLPSVASLDMEHIFGDAADDADTFITMCCVDDAKNAADAVSTLDATTSKRATSDYMTEV